MAALVALFAGAGIGHFAAPGYIRSLLPPWFPFPATTVAVSGVGELVLAAAIVDRRSRPAAARAAAVVLAAYTLMHLEAASRVRKDAPRWIDRPAGGVARVVVNGLYAAGAAWVARRCARVG